MSRVSTVRTHPQLSSIRLSIANGIAHTRIASRYGLTRDAVDRYAKTMAPQELTLLRYKVGDSPISIQQLKESESEGLMHRIVSMLAEIGQVWRLCVDAKDYRVAARVAGVYAQYLEIEAKILGDIAQ